MSAYSFDAVIFDLDGVITQTALVHSTAWKRMFDSYLHERFVKYNEPFKEFRHNEDYLPYVDGKPRYKGVESFLKSRNINIPFGDPSDSPDAETACGLGNKKDVMFNEIVKNEGVKVFESSLKFIHQLIDKGIKIGVASSSKNCLGILQAIHIDHLFQTRVDGVVSAELGLHGKPEPDIFTVAADNLGVTYDRTIIVEDAVSGVQAGQKGNFGLVLGIAREHNHEELRLNGADIVVNDMAEISLKDIQRWFDETLEDEKWSISYHSYEKNKERTREALLAVGNGYFGTRGAMEEVDANQVNQPGTYIAGVYNRLISKVGDRDVENEDFVNCPNWLPINFKIADDNWFDFNSATFTKFYKKLNFHNGMFIRNIVVKDNKGRLTSIESRRIASMDNPHLAAIRYSLKPLNYSEAITFRIGLNGAIINTGVDRYNQLNQKHLEPVYENIDGNNLSLVVRTSQSKIQIAETCKLTIALDDFDIDCDFENIINKGSVYVETQLDLNEGSTIHIEKLVSIYTSQDNTTSPLEAAKKDLAKVKDFKDVEYKSSLKWNEIWREMDIKIEGDRQAQRMMRLHLYHLMVSASQHNATIDASFTARGLHGEAYRGHIFWDELFILPLYNVHYADAAKATLMYRFRRLDKARAYAKEYGNDGAMFPWQSGSDGREETQVVHLNPLDGSWGADFSSMQRHVSLAIAYDVWEYFLATKDLEFIEKAGAEMFLEICRFWASKTYYGENGRYSIRKVMGPDEFHEKYPDAKHDDGGINDNTYTNIMAVWCFKKAFEMLDMMDKKSKQKVLDKIKLSQKELDKWNDISKKMNIVIKDGILSQYDGYFDLAELDWNYYKQKYGNIYRLDRILKAEGKTPDDYKLAKQADTLMTFYNLDEHEVTGILNDLGYKMPKDYLKKNLEYYLGRTSHGSTLSRVVHAQLANMIGDMNLSWELYSDALSSDFNDIQGGTTAEGIHAGVMAGTVLIAMQSYAGVNIHSEIVKINPNLPKIWRSIAFNFHFRDAQYFVEIAQHKIRIKIESDEAKDVAVEIAGKVQKVAVDDWKEFKY